MEIINMEPVCYNDTQLQNLFKYLAIQNIYWEWNVNYPCRILVETKYINKINNYIILLKENK